MRHIVLLIFSSLWLLACDDHVSTKAYLLAESKGKDSIMIAFLDREIDLIIDEANEELAEYAKRIFYPILPMMKSVNARFDSIYNLSKYRENKTQIKHPNFDIDLKTSIQTIFDNISHDLRDFFYDYGSDFGLDGEDITRVIDKTNEKIAAHELDVQRSLTMWEVSKSNDLLFQDLIWKLKYSEYQIVSALKQYYGGKTLECFPTPYRLLVAAKDNTLEEGENFEAAINIVEMVNIDSEDAILTINEDNYRPDENGYFYIKLPSMPIGQYDIDMEVSVINPFTGASIKGYGTHKYVVLPK